MEKEKIVKKLQSCSLVGFYGPPTLGINCHEGGRGGGGEDGGGVVTIKDEEESDWAVVIHEVIQDSVHWCRGRWGARRRGRWVEKGGRCRYSHGKVLPLHSCSRRRGQARGRSEKVGTEREGDTRRW